MSDLWEKRIELKIPTEAEIAAMSPVMQDIWRAILDDGWMWGVTWGKPRTGKTTILLLCSYGVYNDWDLVLQSCFFNLNGFLYRMRKGLPTRILTLNGFHWRIPMLLPDDFGAQCNKAKIQHEPAWDIVKGAWDTFGTKVAVMLGSMGTPSGATEQIQNKYTHEIFVDRRGHAKYDEVEWRQDFGGWRPNPRKEWQYEFTFDFSVPRSVYVEYDEQRMALVDELIQQIDDAQIENEGTRILKLLTEKDIELIEMMFQRGSLSNDWFHRDENSGWIETLKRCKSRGIIVILKRASAYWYDLSDFGISVLNMVQLKKKAEEAARKGSPGTNTQQSSPTDVTKDQDSQAS